MKLEKNGRTVVLNDDSHIAGFKAGGWVEVEETKTAVNTTKPKTTVKSK